MRIFERVVHALAVVAFMFMGSLVIYAVASSFGLQAINGKFVDVFLGILPLLALGLAAWAIHKRLRYWVVLPGLVFLAAVVSYLFIDDEQRPPSPDMGEVVAENSALFINYNWMVKGSRVSRLLEMANIPNPGEWFRNRKPQDWGAHIVAHREEIMRAFETDIVGRQWIVAMSEPTTGVILHTLQGPCLDFSSIRAVLERHYAYVVLRASEKREEEAVSVLISTLKCGYSLQRCGASLVSQMTGSVWVKKGYQVISLLEEQGMLSDASRNMLVQLLESGVLPERVFRNAVYGEAVILRDTIDTIEKGLGVDQDTGRKSGYLRFLQAVIYNPRRTERECRQYYDEVFQFSVGRKPEELGRIKAKFDEAVDCYVFKNSTGKLVKVMAVPPLNAFTKGVWELEDMRLDLMKRLKEKTLPL